MISLGVERLVNLIFEYWDIDLCFIFDNSKQKGAVHRNVKTAKTSPPPLPEGGGLVLWWSMMLIHEGGLVFRPYAVRVDT